MSTYGFGASYAAPPMSAYTTFRWVLPAVAGNSALL
jgi:hypothetical protein